MYHSIQTHVLDAYTTCINNRSIMHPKLNKNQYMHTPWRIHWQKVLPSDWSTSSTGTSIDGSGCRRKKNYYMYSNCKSVLYSKMQCTCPNIQCPSSTSNMNFCTLIGFSPSLSFLFLFFLFLFSFLFLFLFFFLFLLLLFLLLVLLCFIELASVNRDMHASCFKAASCLMH